MPLVLSIMAFKTHKSNEMVQHLHLVQSYSLRHTGIIDSDFTLQQKEITNITRQVSVPGASLINITC